MELSTELPPHYLFWNELYNDLLKSGLRLEYVDHIYVYRAYEQCNVITAGHLPDHGQLKFSVHHIERQALAELRGQFEPNAFSKLELYQLRNELQTALLTRAIVPAYIEQLYRKLSHLLNLKRLEEGRRSR